MDDHVAGEDRDFARPACVIDFNPEIDPPIKWSSRSERGGRPKMVADLTPEDSEYIRQQAFCFISTSFTALR